MPNIVYVNEYQPSSVTLSIGGDPIYKQSNKAEVIRVAVTPIPAIALILGALLTGALMVYALHS